MTKAALKSALARLGAGVAPAQLSALERRMADTDASLMRRRAWPRQR